VVTDYPSIDRNTVWYNHNSILVWTTRCWDCCRVISTHVSKKSYIYFNIIHYQNNASSGVHTALSASLKSFGFSFIFLVEPCVTPSHWTLFFEHWISIITNQIKFIKQHITLHSVQSVYYSQSRMRQLDWSIGFAAQTTSLTHWHHYTGFVSRNVLSTKSRSWFTRFWMDWHHVICLQLFRVAKYTRLLNHFILVPACDVEIFAVWSVAAAVEV